MNRNVMVVDDDHSIRITLKAILEAGGFDVIAVEGGEGCLEELAKGFHGVIIMDIMMPGMDGWATIGEVVEQGFLEGNLILMLTGKYPPNAKVDSLAGNLIYYMTKPFDAKELVATVDRYCSLLEDCEVSSGSTKT